MRAPQGFSGSLMVYLAALQENLADFVFPKGSTLIQYVNDLLVCSTSEENCFIDTNALQKYLAVQGLKASRKTPAGVTTSAIPRTRDLAKQSTRQNSSGAVNA